MKLAPGAVRIGALKQHRMAPHGIPLHHPPTVLEQYKALIRHVHGEPVMLRRAMRLAFRTLSPGESRELRDWLSARYAL
jgi:hypothetical protein